MAEVKLSAEKRSEFGKGAARRTRRAGRIPAVLYGHGFSGTDFSDIAASWSIDASPKETVSTVSSPAQITSDQAAYALGQGRFHRLTSDASRTTDDKPFLSV